MIVKVELPQSTDQSGVFPMARIRNKDGSLVLQVPAGLVSRRMVPGESHAFFNLADRSKEKGALYLGDRVPDQEW